MFPLQSLPAYDAGRPLRSRICTVSALREQVARGAKAFGLTRSGTFFTKARSGILDSGIPYDCFTLIVIVNSPLLSPPFFPGHFSLCRPDYLNARNRLLIAVYRK